MSDSVVSRYAVDLRRHVPLLLYGLRLWAAVCLALFVAFELELDNPSWAGTSAAIVCQPVLGASLRKGWFRMLGTLVGAVVSVVLTAALVQDRFGFLFALALWGGLCAFVATVLRNFAGYAAALAGYTAFVIASDQLGAVGGLNGEVFALAVARGTEICIGIVAAGVVLASTDLGHARQHLVALFTGLATDTLRGTLGSLRTGGLDQEPARQTRRDLIGRVAAMDAAIDQALGEASELRFNPRPLQAGVDGLFTALSGWRAIGNCLERMAPREAADDAAVVLACLPPAVLQTVDGAADPIRTRLECLAAARRLVALHAATPTRRLLADRMAEVLLGVARSLAALGFLAGRGRMPGRFQVARLHVPDLLPAWINGLRSFLAVSAAALIWIVTAWPGGGFMMLFAAITVILFSPREYAAVKVTTDFLIGTAGTIVVAAILLFAVLPRATTFPEFALAIGVVLVPGAALSAQPWHGAAFLAIMATFIPLLAPANPMQYDMVNFYNTAIAIFVGIALALCAMRLLPPMSPDTRARRLLTMTLRDLRQIADGQLQRSLAEWQGLIYGRLAAMPDGAEGLQFARLVAAMALGAEIIRLRRLARRVRRLTLPDDVLRAIADGDSEAAVASLRRLDAVLAASAADNDTDTALILRIRASASLMAQALSQHASFFSARIPT